MEYFTLKSRWWCVAV